MGKSIVSTNRKAYHEFQIIEILEAGLELLGSEVKSLREGKASLKESYIKIGNFFYDFEKSQLFDNKNKI